jgi:hypothetical protein
MFAICYGIVKTVDQCHQAPGLGIIYRFVEVGTYPLAQVFCLPYIQQFILGTIVFITARFMGNGPGNFTEFFSGHSCIICV